LQCRLVLELDLGHLGNDLPPERLTQQVPQEPERLVRGGRGEGLAATPDRQSSRLVLGDAEAESP